MEEQEEVDKFFAEVISESKELAKQQEVYLECTVLEGHEVEIVIKFARERQFDLLVGFMRQSGAFGRIWGGTSQNLTKTSPCSVLVVK
jgi:nucleotide-binding universal stress UspA family protein